MLLNGIFFFVYLSISVCCGHFAILWLGFFYEDSIILMFVVSTLCFFSKFQRKPITHEISPQPAYTFGYNTSIVQLAEISRSTLGSFLTAPYILHLGLETFHF